MKSNKFYQWCIALTSILMLNSCGAIGTTGHVNKLKSSNKGGSSAALENPDYFCPAEPNLKPKFDYWLDGTFFFTACRHKTDQTRALVHGVTAGSDTIRVYPAFYQSSTEIFAFEDTSAPGTILSQMSTIGELGVFVVFPVIPTNTVFNSMFVIEAQDKNQMDACLAAQDYFYCPNFAFGKFK